MMMPSILKITRIGNVITFLKDGRDIPYRDEDVVRQEHPASAALYVPERRRPLIFFARSRSLSISGFSGSSCAACCKGVLYRLFWVVGV